MLILQTSTSEAFYVVWGALVTFILGLAAIITALSIIWTKVIIPLRNKWDERIFRPLEQATKEVIAISETLHRIETRVFQLEENLKKFNLENLSTRLENVSVDVAYAKFKLRLHSKYSKKAIFILNECGECEYVNQSLCDLLDADSSELEGNNWLKRIIASERSLVESELADAYKRRRKFDMEQTIVIGTTRKKIRVQAEPFIYNDEVKKFFGVISVIT